MIRKSTVSILLLSVVAFLGGLAGSLGARSDDRETRPDGPPGPHHPLARHLRLDADTRARIEALDPSFADDLAALREARWERRRELALLLESTESTDDDIRASVEGGIEAHNRFERRVLDHLLLVRQELTPDEQKRLFHSISKRIRGRGFGRKCGPGGDEGDARPRQARPWGRRHRRGEKGGRPPGDWDRTRPDEGQGVAGSEASQDRQEADADSRPQPD